MDYSGKLALVTGAASGIGKAFATALAARGAEMWLIDRDAAALRRTADELTREGRDVHAGLIDVADEAALRHLAAQDMAGRPIDILCLNAGVGLHGSMSWQSNEADFEFILDNNLRAILRGIRAFMPAMVDAPGPRNVVITASMASLVPAPGAGLYAASKAAAVAVAQTLRLECAAAAPHIAVTVVNPGIVKTNLMATSADHMPSRSEAAIATQAMAHQALNVLGIEASAMAERMIEAMERKAFWTLPPAGDDYIAGIEAHVAELRHAIPRGEAG